MRLRRLRLKKISPQLTVAGLFFLCLSFAGAADLKDSPRGDAFVMPAIAEPLNLVPFLASDSASAEISRFLFNGLLKYDKDLNLTGDLAESWEVKDEGRTIVFHLRKNVRWQDGYAFTARDVVFTYLMLVDPNVATPYSGMFEDVETVLAPDPYTVEVRYKEPFSPGLASWTMGIVPKHIMAAQDPRAEAFSKFPVGTGPYTLRRWVRGEIIELRANPTYFEGTPNIERVVLRVLPDPATVFLELQTGNLDTAGLTPLQYNRQIDTDFFKKNYQSYRWNGQQYSYLGYNLKNPLFADKRVRQALAMAMDREEMIRAVLMGRGREISGPFLPESWAYDETVKPLPHDPAAAKALLEEAGWRDNDNDKFLDRDGKRFSFTVLTNGGNDQRKLACEILQKQFADIGVEMKIQVMEWSSLLKQFIHPRRFEAVLLGWNLPMDPDIYDIFHSSRMQPGHFNFVSYKNDEVDLLLEQARRIFDQDERAVLYKQVHRIIYEEQPYAFLFTSEALSVLHRRYQGVTQGKLGYGHDFIDWNVPSSKRKYQVPVIDV